MLQQEIPQDFVIATGQQYSVRRFVEEAAGYFGMHIVWENSGLYEVGIDVNSGKVVINVSDRYFRPTEVDTLLGDPSLAKLVLKWKPKYNFEALVKDMCENER